MSILVPARRAILEPARTAPKSLKASLALSLCALAVGACSRSQAKHAAAPPPPPQPAIVALEPVGGAAHHFGDVFEGAKLPHVFELVHRGEADVHVEALEAKCSCTIASTRIVRGSEVRAYEVGEPIEPGATLQVTTTLDTRERRGELRGGLSLHLGGSHPPISLDLTANVRPLFALDPPVLDLGRFPIGETREGSIAITSEAFADFALELADAEPVPELVAVVAPVDADSNGRSRTWILHASYGPAAAPSSKLHFPLRMRSDRRLDEVHGASAEPRPVEVTAFVEVATHAKVFATPEFLSFGAIAPGAIVRQTFRITSVDPSFGLDLDDGAVALLAERGAFELEQRFRTRVARVDDRTYDVIVELEAPAADAKGPFRGTLEVTTGYASPDKVRVPVFGVCQGAEAVGGATASHRH